jgi:integrase
MSSGFSGGRGSSVRESPAARVLANHLRARLEIKPAFAKLGIAGVGWHTFRHSVGSILATIGEHQLTIRDYLRHSNLSVTNQYLQATSKTKRLAQTKLVDAIPPTGSLSVSKSTLVQ